MACSLHVCCTFPAVDRVEGALTRAGREENVERNMQSKVQFLIESERLKMQASVANAEALQMRQSMQQQEVESIRRTYLDIIQSLSPGSDPTPIIVKMEAEVEKARGLAAQLAAPMFTVNIPDAATAFAVAAGAAAGEAGDKVPQGPTCAATPAAKPPTVAAPASQLRSATPKVPLFQQSPQLPSGDAAAMAAGPAARPGPQPPRGPC